MTQNQPAVPTYTAVSPFERFSTIPAAQGLYSPEAEKDACGLAIIATLRGEAGHDIVDAALTALRALEHRGAVGADEGTGDGAGLLTQVPEDYIFVTSGLGTAPPRHLLVTPLIMGADLKGVIELGRLDPFGGGPGPAGARLQNDSQFLGLRLHLGEIRRLMVLVDIGP